MKSKAQRSPPLIVVGVGASAGGLEAVQAFLQGVQPGTGAAFVVVFHQDPSAKSLLPDVLDKFALLPVTEAVEGLPIEADHVYTAPAQSNLTLEGGSFRLTPLENQRERRTPIDRTLQSVAATAGERGVAVILSGAGSDGALGLKAISDAGGVTFVQEPSTAKHDGMPQSAIATGAADHILTPEALAVELVAYAEHVRRAGGRGDEGSLRRQVEDALPAVCDILLQASGHNFRHYKSSTLARRVLRRVQVLRLASVRQYVERLRANKTEVEQLFNDLLIGVTAFFRDGEAFQTLERDVIPKLLDKRPADQPIRIWCAGCASGEEAYSLAMLVREQMDRLDGAAPDVQIFATDIDEEALAFARQGVYPAGIADEVGPERLRRFFVKKGQQYHVAKELRELVLYSLHNIINDPPFSRLDLISCRNLLIYLGSHLQKKLIPLFHYALRPGGYLFLGPSESLSDHRELFRPIDAKHRVSQRLPTAIRTPGPTSGRSGIATPVRPPNVPSATDNEPYLLMQRIILDEFAPKAVVVDEDGKIVCASGNLEKYLTVSAGAFHNSLTRLARDGLSVGVRAALAEAARVRRKIVNDGLSLRTDEGIQRVMVTVQPMPHLGEETGLFVVVFQDVGRPLGPEGAEQTPPTADAAALIEQLERELATTRGDLERTVQDLESANEELKSGNEELLSMNEELQSANEELEVSKEEVQAANDSLARINTDLENLLASTQIATLFLDIEGNLRWVSPAAANVYRVRPDDAGRPLDDFTHRARKMPPLPAVEDVCASTKAFEDDVEMTDGTHLLRRVSCYRNRDGAPEGVVVTFIDVTERKAAETASARLAAIVSSSNDAIASKTLDGIVTSWNATAERMFGYTANEIVGRSIRVLIPPERHTEEDQILARLRSGEPIQHYETVRVAKDGRRLDVSLSISPLKNSEGRVVGVSKIIRDVGERKRMDAQLQAERDRVQFVADAVPALISYVDADTRYRLVNHAYETWFHHPSGEVLGRPMQDVVGEAAWRMLRPHVEKALGGQVATYEAEVPYRDGGTRWISATYTPDIDEDGVVRGMVAHVTDITKRKRIEEALKQSEERFRGLMEQAPSSIQILSPDGRTLDVNHAWEKLWGVTREQLRDYNMLEDQQLAAKGVLPLIKRAFAGEAVQIPVIPYDPNETIPDVAPQADPVRYVAAVAYPLKDEAGQVREVVLVHEDVTARERAEEAIRLSEERLRLALDAGRMGVWDWNVRTNAIEWSATLEPIHGLAPGTFAGTFEAFQALVHPEDRGVVSAAVRQSLEEQSSYDIEFRVVWPDGSVHWMAGKGKVFSEGGRPLRMIGVGLDVTDRKRTEQDSRFLADASATLAALVDYQSTLQKVARLAVPHFADWCSVDMLDAEGRLQRVATAHVDPSKLELAHELHRRFPPDPAAPTGVWRILRTGEAELIPEITNDLIEASVDDPELLEIIRALGLRSYIGVPLTAFGKTKGVITFIAAESGRRYDEDDLAVAKDLAHRAAVAIENARLYLEVRDADRKKDEFLSILAHELRNPLAPIRNALEIFRLADGNRAAIDQAREMAERQVHALTRMVDDLLDVSRIMRGKIELRMARVDLASAVSRAVETARPVLDADDHRLVVAMPHEPIWVNVDLVRMAQVVSNLLANAAKYSDAGTEIRLTAGREDDHAVVRVHDQGIGIAPEKLRSVFDLFVQVDAAGLRAQGGLGIGLTVVQNLIEMHGGSVEARSEGLGKGSEFIVRLPIAPANAPIQEPPSAPPAERRKRRRILVVDDHIDAAESLALLLELQGHEVHVAHDGRTGLSLAQANPPEVAFFDVGMPDIDGNELARRFRANPRLRGVWLVALTGWGQQQDRRRTREAGFDHHLVKPPEPEALDAVFAEIDAG